MKSLTTLLSLLALCLVFTTLAACNTTKGVGKDIEKAGDGLKDSAHKHGAD